MARGTAKRRRQPRWRELGLYVAARRAQLGLTQHDLARATGYNQSSIAAIEAGRMCPSREGLRRLAAALRLPERQLAELAGYLPPEGAVPIYVPPEDAADVQRFASLPRSLRELLWNLLGPVERRLGAYLASEKAYRRREGDSGRPEA